MAEIFLLALALCVAIIALLLQTRIAWRIATDVPNGRSLHNVPIPRIGGWGLVPAAIAASLILSEPDWHLAGLAVLLFAVSYLDDRVSLPIYVRLPAHVAVASAWLAWGPVSLPLYVAAMAAFAIVWVTNFFNFMDGADGLAGGMAIIGFSAFATVAAGAGVTPLAVWSLALAGASVGFLVFNFPPARIFLGDAGSVTLGFLAGTFGIWGWAAGAWPVWFPFLVSAPFFLDATITILRRMARRERFWRAHREHYYQRLIRSGWSHRRTAFFEYVLMAASAGFAVTMLEWSTRAQYAGLSIAAAVYVAIGWAIDRRWAAFERGAEEPSLRDSPAASADVSSSTAVRQPLAAAGAAELIGSQAVAEDTRAAARSRRIATHEPEFVFNEPALTGEPDRVVQKQEACTATESAG